MAQQSRFENNKLILQDIDNPESNERLEIYLQAGEFKIEKVREFRNEERINYQTTTDE